MLLPVVALIAVVHDVHAQRWEYDSHLNRYTVEVVATGLGVPFGLAFLPDGRALVTDRTARNPVILDTASGILTPVEGGPVPHITENAGWLDVVVHPEFATNKLIYYAYADANDTGITTVVERAELRGQQLVQRQRLFTAYPSISTDHHLGARLALRDGYLFVTLGDRDIRELAQELWTDHGKIIRIFDDGRIPRDNPFIDRRGARPGIWTFGNRNPHGLAFNLVTGDLWQTEHGPLAGDEINIVRRGANYGWPIVTFGREYAGGNPIGDGLTEAPGMEPPVYHYANRAALSGMVFYSGRAFPQWRNNLFVGAMGPRYLGRLTIENGRPVREERLLTDQRWRVRVVQEGPDGFIYLGVDRSANNAKDGKIVRLRPS